jgi:hypothetical protein
MFETASDGWKRYLSHVSSTWAENDARHSLGTEVTERLRQLDVIIRLLQSAINNVTPDRAEMQRIETSIEANLLRLQSGEITVEEYIELVHPAPSNAAKLIESWDLISIYTEAFYFWAWRLREILNNRTEPYRFPDLGQIDARLITLVRNNLIEHPESAGSRDFTLGLVITSSGPVLRSLGVVVRDGTGRIEPLAESKDQGLFAAAEELREELNRKINNAVAKSTTT